MKDRLETFIRKRINSVADKVQRFALLHVIEQRPPQTLLTRKVNREELEDEIVSITDEFRETAQDHSAEASRTQRYQVVAYGEQSEVIGTYTFRLRPNPDTIDPGESEPATSTGALALSMRLTESYAKMTLAALGSLVGQQSEVIAQLSARNRHLEEKNIEGLELLETLMTSQNERDMALMKEAKKEERKDRLLTRGEQIVGQLLPAMLDNMSAKKPIQEFLGSLDDDQTMAILQTLRPDQVKKLGELLEEKGGNDGKGNGKGQ